MSCACISPFRVAIRQADLDELRTRLSRSRWPEPQTTGIDNWNQGVPLREAQRIVNYWHTQYEWRRCEERLNQLGGYRTTIEDLGIYFLHVRSPHSNALPIILTHGWPGSIIDFIKSIGPLTDPTAHGGLKEDAFHVVIPSLPGYGFTDKPTAGGWDANKTAGAWIELMARLGYDKRWCAQGGDWGAVVTKAIAGKNPPGCVGIHLNSVSIKPTELEEATASTEEADYIQRSKFYTDVLSGYAKEQTTRPQTIGYSLADSPAGQGLWIYEKFHDWTDCAGNPESILTLDEILDDITLYWLTNSGASSARMYAESYAQSSETPPTRVAVAVSQFPKDLGGASERWTKRRYPTLMYWNNTEKGGHFAAFEQPTIFVREVRAGLRGVR